MAEPLEEFPWESSYQYRCRAGKIREFAPRLGPLKATALANVWANHHFLGCMYPDEVMGAIAHWRQPPKDDSLERKKEEIEVKEKEAMYDPDLVNPNLTIRDFRNLVLHEGQMPIQPSVVILYNSCQTCHFSIDFQEKRVSAGRNRKSAWGSSVWINDLHVSDGGGPSQREAKHASADNALKYLKKLGVPVNNPGQLDPEAVSQVSKDVLCGGDNKDNEYAEHKIEDDNVGAKLLKAMGWKEDTGLGKDGQGMKNPIGTSGQVSRGGLGSINSQIGICHQSVNAKLTAFIRNPDLKKLEFTAELENVERKVIHNICNKLRLKHKSHGKGANRRLTVWKDEVSVSDWIMDVPVTEFAEEEEEGLELHTGDDEDFAARDPSDHMTGLSLHPNSSFQPRRAPVFPSSGKRKKKSNGNKAKVTRTDGHVPFEGRGEGQWSSAGQTDPRASYRRNFVLSSTQGAPPPVPRARVHAPQEIRDPRRNLMRDPYLSQPAQPPQYQGNRGVRPRHSGPRQPGYGHPGPTHKQEPNDMRVRDSYRREGFGEERGEMREHRNGLGFGPRTGSYQGPRTGGGFGIYRLTRPRR